MWPLYFIIHNNGQLRRIFKNACVVNRDKTDLSERLSSFQNGKAILLQAMAFHPPNTRIVFEKQPNSMQLFHSTGCNAGGRSYIRSAA